MANSIIVERKKRERAAREANIGKAEQQQAEGVDTSQAAMVQSGFSAFNQSIPKETAMTEDTDKTAKAAAQASKKAEREAKAAAAQAEKEAKAKAKAEKKAQEAAEATERQKQFAAEREAKKATIEAEQAALREKGLTYTGSMLALRSAKENYVKGPGGRLHSGDPVATAFATLTPQGVISVCLGILGIANKYEKLNVGQQSMNLRNLVRGGLKKGTLTPEAVVGAVEAADPSLTVAGVKAERAAADRARLDMLAAKRAEKEAAAQAEKEAKAKAKAKAAAKAEKEVANEPEHAAA